MRRRILFVTLGLAAIAIAGAPPASGDEVRTLSGDHTTIVEDIERTATGLRITTAQGRLDGETVREIRFSGATPAPRSGSARLFLRNGDEIPGELEAGGEETVTIASPTLGRVAAPLEWIAGVAFASDARHIDRFREKAIAATPDLDFVVLQSWGRKEGTVERIDKAGVTIELSDVGSVTLGPDRLMGVRLAPLGELPEPTGLMATLELTCGGSVSGRLEYLKAGFCGIETPYLKARIPARHVRSISLSGGRFRYVSDLTPVEVEERNQVIDAALAFPHRRDGAVLGGPLVLGGKTYRKGIGVKAHTRLAFEIDGGYRRFRALIGLDDTTRQQADVDGTARFQVLGDGKPLLHSGGLVLTSRDAPRAIDIPVEGVSRLELVCDFGPSGDVLARGAWADAYLVK